MEPGLKERLDVAAAARLFESRAHAAALDDEQRRDPVDLEALEELGMLVGVHPVQPERFVVVALLQHLGEESLDAPAAPRRRRVEEDESRAARGGLHAL